MILIGMFDGSIRQKLYLPANNSTQMASSARYIDAASGNPITATTIDAMISASETTDDVRFLISRTTSLVSTNARGHTSRHQTAREVQLSQ